ncbi:MAG: tetratricopeptide repeat protein [Thermoguttaceae bacterium]
MPHLSSFSPHLLSNYNMSIDPYALCPGGHTKKIRFCCSDIIKEIEQIERLLGSNQGAACLSLIESLEKTHPDRACLVAAKLAVLRTENRLDEAFPLAESFYKREPENPVAASEYAIVLTAKDKMQEALSVVIDAFERVPKGTAYSTLLEATLQLGAVFLMRGLVIPACGLGNQLKRFPSVQEQANKLLTQATSLVELPLMLRDMMFEYDCPDSFPGRDIFEDALESLTFLRWKEGLAKLELLIPNADKWPTLWWNIAIVRFWLLRNDEGCEALRLFAKMPNTPLEDAVDAESIRLFLLPNPLGDETRILKIEYPITDPDRAQEIMLSAPIFQHMTLDTQMFREQNVPPPRIGANLLDKPFVDESIPLSLETISSLRAACFLFGKETDRAARLELINVVEDQKADIEHELRSLFGDIIQEAVRTDALMSVSRSQLLSQYRFKYSSQREIKPEEIENLERDYYNVKFIDKWCKLPLGLLDNRTPSEASSDPNYRIRILAAIQLIEHWINEEAGINFSNALRTRLGLPTRDTIEIPEGSDEEKLQILDQHPVWRWFRFDVSKLPTSALVEGIQIVAIMREPRSLSRFAKELLDRPITEMPPEARSLAFSSLIGIARGLGNSEEALEWIQKAKHEAAQTGSIDAEWCLHEIPLRLGLNQIEEAHNVIQDIVTRYKDNQQVMMLLQQMFVQLGLLNPDGTPTLQVQQSAARTRTMNEIDGESHNKIWTPEGSDAPASGKTSALWTPDM